MVSLLTRLFVEFSRQEGTVFDGYPDEEPFIAIVTEMRQRFLTVPELMALRNDVNCLMGCEERKHHARRLIDKQLVAVTEWLT